jgi:hypothetical protein
MLNPKLRRVCAMTTLLAALSLVPAQAAGFAARGPRQASVAERFERLGVWAWSFLTGFFDKQRSEMNPDGLRVTSSSDGDGH